MIFRGKQGAYIRRTIFWRVWRAACDTVGLPDLTVHGARHSVTSWLANTPGLPLVLVRDMLGHSSLAITNTYVYAIDNGGDERAGQCADDTAGRRASAGGAWPPSANPDDAIVQRSPLTGRGTRSTLDLCAILRNPPSHGRDHGATLHRNRPGYRRRSLPGGVHRGRDRRLPASGLDGHRPGYAGGHRRAQPDRGQRVGGQASRPDAGHHLGGG